jgi:hypothetical protein
MAKRLKVTEAERERLRVFRRNTKPFPGERRGIRERARLALRSLLEALLVERGGVPVSGRTATRILAERGHRNDSTDAPYDKGLVTAVLGELQGD